MSLEKNSEWINPEKLLLQEKKTRESSGKVDTSGDFGSYKLLNEGKKDNTGIELHNCVGDAAKLNAILLKKFIQKNKFSSDTIADMGAGAGYVANSIAQEFPLSKVISYEISQDAVDFSTKEFLKVQAHQMTISPESKFQQDFNVIFAREFYPFTRTNSYEFQKNFLSNFLQHTVTGGGVLVQLLKSKECLLNNLKELKEDFPEIKIELFPSTRIYKLIPFLAVAQFVTAIYNILKNQNNSYLLVMKK
jgi:cyclopropane fatty-acyl-phospholipid synthase-like methyltransferase